MVTFPRNWISTSVGSVTLPVFKIDQSECPEDVIRYIDISSIDNKRYRISNHKDYIVKDAPSRARQIIKVGDVLFSTVRPYLKNIAQVTDQYDGEVASTGFSVLRPANGLNPKYLYFFSTYSDFINSLSEDQYGVSYPAVKDDQVREKLIPLPPENEQHRIVTKIEELFSELDKGIESLKTAREQLKVYRQALLKHAFEGKLTEQWRKDNADKLETGDQLLERIKREREACYQRQLEEWKAAVKRWEAHGEEGKKPIKPSKHKEVTAIDPDRLKELNQVSSNWAWLKLSAAFSVTGGLTKNSKRESYSCQMHYLRVANVYANQLDLSEVKTIGVQPQEIDRVALQKGDLLIVEGNGSLDQIGRVAVWSGEIEPCLHQNHLIKARPLPSIHPSFVLYFLLSRQGRDFIVKEASSTSGLHTLSLSKVGSLMIPITSSEEQKKILSILEEKLSVIERTDIDLADNLSKSEALRQSILKKAFSGQLVPQDPNDEPASVLLERIAKEKEATTTKIKKTKSMKNKP